MLVAMLIWIGGIHGGPAVLTGFDTMPACEAARPLTERAYARGPSRYFDATVWTACLEVKR